MNGLTRVSALVLGAALMLGAIGCHTTVVQPVEQQPAQQAPPPDHHDDRHPPPPPPPPPDHRDDRPQDHH